MRTAAVPTMPAPITRDAAARHAGHAAEQHAAPALVRLQIVRADLHREPARDLAHGHEQRQRAVRRAAPSRSRSRRSRVRGCARVSSAVGREVQEVEEHLAGPHGRDLRRRRLLHLGDDVALSRSSRPATSRSWRRPPRTAASAKPLPSPAPASTQHLVPARPRARAPAGQQGDPQLAVLGLAQHADAHDRLLRGETREDSARNPLGGESERRAANWSAIRRARRSPDRPAALPRVRHFLLDAVRHPRHEQAALLHVAARGGVAPTKRPSGESAGYSST